MHVFGAEGWWAGAGGSSSHDARGEIGEERLELQKKNLNLLP